MRKADLIRLGGAGGVSAAIIDLLLWTLVLTSIRPGEVTRLPGRVERFIIYGIGVRLPLVLALAFCLGISLILLALGLTHIEGRHTLPLFFASVLTVALGVLLPAYLTLLFARAGLVGLHAPRLTSVLGALSMCLEALIGVLILTAVAHVGTSLVVGACALISSPLSIVVALWRIGSEFIGFLGVGLHLVRRARHVSEADLLSM